MAATKYTITTDQVNIIEYENYSEKDRALVDSFKVNSLFDVSSHFIELHIYSLDGRRLASEYNYTRHKQLLNSESAGKTGAVNLSIDPIEDVKEYGFTKGGVKLLYHYLSNLFSLDNTRNFYIETISPDRTELRLLSPKFSDEDLSTKVEELKTRFAEDPYFNEIRLNFSNNDLFIGVNIETEEYQGRTAILIKLYEPLPEQYSEKDILSIVEQVSDSTQYTVDSTTEAEKPKSIKLRGPNFDLEVNEESVVPTEYLTFNELFAYPVTSSYHEVYSLVADKGIRLSVDYTDFSDFVKFSSAEERVQNFVYKVGLIQEYEAALELAKTSTAASTPQTGSVQYYENLIKGTVENFDGYERFLYYESGSGNTTWPKTGTGKPYVNDSVTSPAALAWISDTVTSASYYDNNNPSALRYTLPEFIKDNPDNVSATVFLDMLGQHFDNIWLYADAVTEKYNADNRLNYGISRDLVEDALKNFGVKLYTSNFSTDNLYTSLIDYVFDPGCELTGSFISVDEYSSYFLNNNFHDNWRFTPPPLLDVSSTGDYTQEVYKRIYHNLAFLLKTKGTHRGVRALINCFGIPSNILSIEEYGGFNREDDYYYGYQLPYTSSVDKIRLDNTGSIVDTTLSSLVSIQKPADKYNQDLHTVEVGFSPTTHVNNYITNEISNTFASWSLDDYIGYPSQRRSRNYPQLDKLAETILEDVTRYDVFDFIRLIRFFDNTVFKMIKDFTPARAVTTTGIIIKPHVLDRSKIQSPVMVWSRPEYSGSIDTAFIQGSEGSVVTSSYSTSHSLEISTANGTVLKPVVDGSPTFNGELSGTETTVSTQNLNLANQYKQSQQPYITYSVTRSSKPNPIFVGYIETYAVTPIVSGRIDIRYLESFGPTSYDLLDGKISKTTSNGVDVDGNLNTITEVHVQGNIYKVVNVTEFSTYYYVEFEKQFNVVRVTAGSYPINFSGYVDKLFYFSEYNVLVNNSERSRQSTLFQEVDRNSGIVPQNLPAINSNQATPAQVQDSNYSSNAYSNIRYNGSILSSAQLNKYTAGDISYGKTPAVESVGAILAQFSTGGGTSPEILGAGALKLDALLTVGKSRDSVEILYPNIADFTELVEQGFEAGSKVRLYQYSNSPINIGEVTIAAPAVQVPTKSAYMVPSDDTLARAELTDSLLGTNGILFGVNVNKGVYEVEKDSNGNYITGNFKIGHNDFIPSFQTIFNNSDSDWYVSVYSTISSPVVYSGGTATVAHKFTNAVTPSDPLGYYGVAKIVGVVNGTAASYGLILDRDLIPLDGEEVGIDKGILIWESQKNGIVIEDSTLSGIGPGMLYNDYSNTPIKENLEYISTTYGSKQV